MRITNMIGTAISKFNIIYLIGFIIAAMLIIVSVKFLFSFI